jgi:serine protease Do
MQAKLDCPQTGPAPVHPWPTWGLRARIVGLANLFTLALAGMLPAQAQPTSDFEAQARALKRATDGVVGVSVQAVDDARSNATLGRNREGSGVVIGPDGLVLTIGYLVLEAETVQLTLDGERELPARVVAYDLATGFGLVQALAPLPMEPVPLGQPGTLADDDPLLIASGGAAGAISVANLVSRRSFAGYWEYAIDGALFTSPPRSDHSGAALFNGRGELMGIGSLFVADALGADHPNVPGNMFVPVDLLTPILADLRARGVSQASRRAWLGINCVEQGGQVRVVRVNTDSPADVAGLLPGDRIVSIDGVPVKELAVLWKSLWAGGLPEREVTLEVRRGDDERTVKLQSVDRMKTLSRARGV